MVVNLRRGAPDSAGTTLPSAGGLLRDPSCSQLDPSRTLPIGELLPRSQILCAVSGCRTQKKKKKKKNVTKYKLYSSIHDSITPNFVLDVARWSKHHLSVSRCDVLCALICSRKEDASNGLFLLCLQNFTFSVVGIVGLFNWF